ncbi:hypothetical protein D9M68_832240 [compost metagenome]
MAIARRSRSRDRFCAPRSSSSGRRPVFSPLAIRCTSRDGNTFCAPSDADSAAPSRTRADASSTASRSTSLPSVRRAASSAVRSDTPLPDRMASVEAKRAAFTPSTKRPASGRRSTRACQARRAAGARSV